MTWHSLKEGRGEERQLFKFIFFSGSKGPLLLWQSCCFQNECPKIYGELGTYMNCCTMAGQEIHLIPFQAIVLTHLKSLHKKGLSCIVKQDGCSAVVNVTQK
uniref:Uncharacterized protein n=1 Tax=Micrurus lemniscatus lemniscatus TaxID=129467 RepID=A0A2D4HWG0_MICLE